MSDQRKNQPMMSSVTGDKSKTDRALDPQLFTAEGRQQSAALQVDGLSIVLLTDEHAIRCPLTEDYALALAAELIENVLEKRLIAQEQQSAVPPMTATVEPMRVS